MTGPLVPFPIEARVRALAACEPGPFYVYDAEAIRRRCCAFRAIRPRATSVHFACMANPHPRILETVRGEGLGLFVNSVRHLALALDAGFRGEEIVFAASAMDDHGMREVAACGARVILDSAGQIARWRRVAPGAPFGVRCNLGGLVEPRQTRGGFFIGADGRLGLLPDELASLHGAADVAGLHVYVGTDIADPGYFTRCYRALADLAPPFPALEFIDIGGGFGLAGDDGRRFDVEALGRAAGQVVDELAERLGREIRLLIEPGRILAAEAGWFVCRVEDVKRRAGRQLVGVNASTAQFPRPLLYPETARHPVALLPADIAGGVDARAAGAACLSSDVFGCSTYSRDYLAREVSLPPAAPGDLVVLGQAGSYCAALFTEFLGFSRPREFFDEPEGAR